MSTVTTRPTSHDTLAHMAADIHQLTAPIHIAIRGRIITHPPLLDQLRRAATPANAERLAGRRVPDSHPPANLDAIDRLTIIYVQLTDWHVRLALPTPPRDTDWQKSVLRQLVGAAPTLAPAIADQLADDVHTWWRTAAIATGWRPEHLRAIR